MNIFTINKQEDAQNLLRKMKRHFSLGDVCSFKFSATILDMGTFCNYNLPEQAGTFL